MSFDPLTAVLDVGNKLIDRLWPDPAQRDEAKFKLVQLQQSGELAQLTAETDLAKGQLEVNKAEAQNPSLFVAGWRPYIGWVCGTALTYQFVVRPIGEFVLASIGHPITNLPGLDDTLWQLLFGMLGLGGLRSFEKVKGVAAK